MSINPPSQVRAVLYILSVFVNASAGVLTASEVHLSVWIVAGLAGFNAVVAAMAVSNVSNK
jgi:hypothetical protein